MTIRNLAIACQGGGSHCAFEAGVLIELLTRLGSDRTLKVDGQVYRVSGLSGTSGGAINALLAWLGLVHPTGPDAGRQALMEFWRDMSASSPSEAVSNFLTVQSVRLRGYIPYAELAPNAMSAWAHRHMGELLSRHVPFEQLPQMASHNAPKLLIGAANVQTGKFKTFGKYPGEWPRAEEILASTAVPSLFAPVEVDGQFYWDGLLSQNPPVRDFLQGCAIDAKPDAIWVIRINPREHQGTPSRLTDILDRQNEMAGNISLEQEKFFIEQVNQWLSCGALSGPFKHVDWREIELGAKKDYDGILDYASKLDRDPVFIQGLIAMGCEEARRFLGVTVAEHGGVEPG